MGFDRQARFGLRLVAMVTPQPIVVLEEVLAHHVWRVCRQTRLGKPSTHLDAAQHKWCSRNQYQIS